MKRLRSVACAILLFTSASAYGQGVGCQRLAVAVPEGSSPEVDQHVGPMGMLILFRLTGQPISGDKVLFLKGEDLVWPVVVRGGFGCPLAPVLRSAYEAARRPLLGISG